MNLLEINVFILGFESEPGAMKLLFSRSLWSANYTTLPQPNSAK